MMLEMTMLTALKALHAKATAAEDPADGELPPQDVRMQLLFDLWHHLPAILARLELAEKFVERVRIVHSNCMIGKWCEDCALLAKWEEKQ